MLSHAVEFASDSCHVRVKDYTVLVLTSTLTGWIEYCIRQPIVNELWKRYQLFWAANFFCLFFDWIDYLTKKEVIVWYIQIPKELKYSSNIIVSIQFFYRVLFVIVQYYNIATTPNRYPNKIRRIENNFEEKRNAWCCCSTILTVHHLVDLRLEFRNSKKNKTPTKCHTE